MDERSVGAGAGGTTTATRAARPMTPSVGQRLLGGVAVGGLSFQLLHVSEHAGQLVAWAGRPTAPPWLSPWAETGRDALAALASGRADVGAELLHLIGNLVFLVAIVALAVGRPSAQRHGRWRQAFWLQGAHVAEHVTLTLTSAVGGTALGLTTVFGAVDGATLTSLRVLSHFLLNAAATVAAVRAVRAVGVPGASPDPAVARPVTRAGTRPAPAASRREHLPPP